jgi:hypothetical protein
MDFPFTSPVTKEPNNILSITIETIVFGVSGLLLGTIINKLFLILSKKYKNYTIPISILQIGFSGALIGVMYFYMSIYFTDHFQRTLSGIAFPALFYSVQSNIFLSWKI